MTIYETIQVECFFLQWTIPALLIISVLLMIAGAIVKGNKGWLTGQVGLYTFISLIVISLILPNADYLPLLKANAMTKTALRAFEMSLIEYSIDHDGEVPSDFTVLLDAYLDEWPENVYTGNPMRNVRFGTEPCHGEFTYMPVFNGEKSLGFFLIAYGSQYQDGMDINDDGDHDNVIYMRSQPEDLDPQLLIDILNSDA